jgi:uncharacterized membrane protein YgcG
VGHRSSRARWTARPAWSRVIRVAVFLGPVAASLVTAWLVTQLLPPFTGLGGRAVHLGILIACSTVVLVLVDRAGRRLLPLVTLLDLTMLFPETAPSRMRIAREAIRRRPVEEQLKRVREAGGDPNTAASEILSLVAAMSVHDRPTRGHAERVRLFTDLIAEEMRLPQRERDLLRWAAILHDIGKLRIPATLLNKPGVLSPYEWSQMRAHPAHGNDIAKAMVPWLGQWGGVILEHHERYDGTGYPRGLAGGDINLGARIVSVADAFDVMTSARAYRRPVSRAAAYRELVRFSGTQFDPAVVRAMVSISAPRLRRAQGLLAWLADIPLVAGNVVPAATVARVVGAGFVATGAVAGGSIPLLPHDPGVVSEQHSTSQPGHSRTGSAAPSTAPGAAVAKKHRPTKPTAGKPATKKAKPTKAKPTSSRGGGSTHRPPSKASAEPVGGQETTAQTPAGSNGGGSSNSGSGSHNSGSGSSGGSGKSGSGSGGGTLDDTVDEVVDGVAGTVDDASGSVDSLVGGLLSP